MEAVEASAAPSAAEASPPSTDPAGTGVPSAEDTALLAATRGEYGDPDLGLVVGRIFGPPGPGEVRLIWRSDDARQVQASRVDLDEDGDTELSLLLDPGTWSVHLDCPSCFREQQLTRDLHVEARRVSRPPELNPLDLGPFVDVAEVRVVDLSGAPYTRADLAVGGRVRDTDESGVARFLLCKAEHSLKVRSFGYRTVKGALRPGFQEVVMRRGPRVRFSLDPNSARPSNDVTVGTTLFREAKAVGGVVVLGDEWTRATALSEPGTYRVVWSLRLPDATRPTFLADSPHASSSIDVKDVDEVQDFVLHFSPVRLSEALESLEDGR